MHAKLLSGGQDDATHNRLGTAGMQGTGGTGRPGCGAGGQRRSQDDTQTTSAARLDAAAEPGQASRHGPGHSAGGRRRGLAGLVQATQVPPVWRAPEGRAAVPVGGGGAWPGFEPTREPHISNQAPTAWRVPEKPAAVPVGGGEAWPGFEPTRRSATRPHWCGGRRRDRRARAGFEARRRTK